jgi:hypothetical protein
MRDIVFEDVSPPSKSYKSSIIKRTADDTYDEMSQTNSPNLFVKKPAE